MVRRPVRARCTEPLQRVLSGDDGEWRRPRFRHVRCRWNLHHHYALLVDEAEFDAIFERIRASGVRYWTDPGRRESGTVNRHDGGRGVYFPSPDDHLFEIITVRYGGVTKPG